MAERDKITWDRPAPHPDGCDCSWCAPSQEGQPGDSE